MTILIVDDEPFVLRYLAAILQGDGYEVLVADGGDEALAICKSAACCFDLMITDVAMPRMNGRELAECMNLRHPNAPIIFVSGYPKSVKILAGLTGRGFTNGYTYVKKPFVAKELLAIVRAALNPSITLTARPV
jgi:two-component system cell cycle sensor histidine kinase/response regulator CckA